jgi:PD-(D/E)XK nuclease superfamily
VTDAPAREELEAAGCVESSDLVARSPAMTAFRQRTRLHQARWRAAHGHPIGSQPYAPRPGVDVRPIGSRIPLDYGRRTGANLVTEAAREAARRRMALVEREQSIDHRRLWADLLSSEALAFNLFGDLAADHRCADRAIHAWWPDAPGHVSEVRFLHSPGRLDPDWLNSLRQFDAVFVLDRGDGTNGIVALDVNYHERLKPETPKPENLWRLREVHDRSGVFLAAAWDRLHVRSELWSPWLEHLLLLSMLQHPSGAWTWGRYVVVHPASNVEMADMGARYRALLADDATFGSVSIETLLGRRILPAATVRAIRERYLPA